MRNSDDPKGTGPTSPMEAERLRRRLQARRERIMQAICDNSRLRPPERRRVAENLWRIMEEARSRRADATHARILHRAGRGDGTDSTKYGYNYLIDPDWPDAKRATRTKKLIQTLHSYREIAQAAAECAGLEDRDAYLLDLVRGTGIEAEIESSMPPDDPRREGWEALCRCIGLHADRIAQDYSLGRYFALQKGWQMSMRAGVFEPGAYRREEPTLFLGWVEPGWYRPGVLEFNMISPDDAYGADASDSDRAEFEKLSQPGALCVAVHVHSVVVLHLVLAPEGLGGAVIPCLRARCRTYVVAAERSPHLVPEGDEVVERGQILALLDRALLGPAALSGSRLPASLTAGRAPAHRSPATVHDVEERELFVSPSDISGLVQDAAELRMEGDGPAVLAPFSGDDWKAPHLIEPLGETALALLELPVSWTPMLLSRNEDDQNWLARMQRAPRQVQQALVFPQMAACLNEGEVGLQRATEIADRAAPFKAGSMLAALGRAMWSEPGDEAASGVHQEDGQIHVALRRSASELTTALEVAVAKAEARWDAGLHQSLAHHETLRQGEGGKTSSSLTEDR